MKQLTKHSGN